MQEDLKIQLDFRHKIPLSDQVQTQLRGLIQSGMLQPDSQLPTVRQLAAQLHINFNTVARAYRVLDEEGWISTQQGRGTYVLEASIREQIQLHRVEVSDEAIAQQAAVSPTDIKITSEVAAPLGEVESSETIASGDMHISIDSTVTKDSAEITDRDTSTDSGVSPASAATTTSAKDTFEKSPERTEVGKEKEINAWVERLIKEAAQNKITVEDLYQALGQRLVSTQARVEVSPRKMITRQPIKQSRKPRHLYSSVLEKRNLPIHASNRKKVKGLKK